MDFSQIIDTNDNGGFGEKNRELFWKGFRKSQKTFRG